MDRMGQIFSGMVMDEAMKDKEKEFERQMEKLTSKQFEQQDTEEMKVDDYGCQEKVRKDSLDSDEDFNIDDDEGTLFI